MKINGKIAAVALLSCAVGALATGLIDRYNSINRVRASYASWYKLNYVLSQVDRNYVDTVDRQSATDAALAAALAALDPHSVYMTPEPLKEAEEDLQGDFEGVGLQFNVPNDTAVVLSVIPGGPSEKAGLGTGDRILKVDSRNIAGTKTPQDTMVRLMRGPKGTKVVLTVGRDGERIPFEITRDKIPEKCVDAAFMMDDGRTGYVRLTKFTKNTYAECVAAFKSLEEKGMQRLVFDLRSNTGGYYDQVCNLANLFLPEDALIVYMEGLHRKRQDTRANGRGTYQDLPLAVLIDDGSASASEIFAGAIQDNDRGTVVGRRSFGKGLVQEPIFFTDGSGLRLTVARFYTPSGRCIQKPYGKDYAYDFYERYSHGELTCADSIRVDSTKVYNTVGGRTVYGGGGIIPDVFVPMDTTRATPFHSACNKKALTVRFASKFFDSHRADLRGLKTFEAVKAYMDSATVEADFLAFAASLGVKPSSPAERRDAMEYLLPQIKGLAARYSPVGEEAYYRYILPLDNAVGAAVKEDF